MINAHMLTINLVKASFDETFEVRRTIIGHSLLHTSVELFEKISKSGIAGNMGFIGQIHKCVVEFREIAVRLHL